MVVVGISVPLLFYLIDELICHTSAKLLSYVSCSFVWLFLNLNYSIVFDLPYAMPFWFILVTSYVPRVSRGPLFIFVLVHFYLHASSQNENVIYIVLRLKMHRHRSIVRSIIYYFFGQRRYYLLAL